MDSKLAAVAEGVSDMADAKPTAQRFHHYVFFLLPFAVLFELGMLSGGYLMLGDPGWASAKGLTVILVWFGANAVLVDLIHKIWKTRFVFTVSSSGFVVTDPVQRTERVVPWGAVTAVEKIEKYWWNRGGGICLNRITLQDGHEVLFGTHLSNYSRFLEGLARNAVACEHFGAYRMGIGERASEEVPR